MFDSTAFPHQSKQYSLTPKIEMATPVQNRPIMHCKPLGIEYVMYAYGLRLFLSEPAATNNKKCRLC